MRRRDAHPGRGPRRLWTAGAGARGASFLELTLVLAILATLAGLAIPRYADSVARYRAEAAARRIVADLALARSQAYTSGAAVAVEFEVESSLLRSSELQGLDGGAPGYVVNFAEPPYRATVLSAGFGGDAVIVFDGYGVPDSGGTAVVQVGQIQKTVQLDPETGKATVQ